MVYLKNFKEENIYFLDIETVRGSKDFTKDSKDPLYFNWEYKMRKEEEKDLRESYLNKAPLYAEFSKVVCISLGAIDPVGNIKTFSYVGDNEYEILTKFTTQMQQRFARNPNIVICGHTIKGFDLPFLAKRLIVNGLSLPTFLDTFHLKPWEQTFILDIAELWKGTGYYNSSLTNMCFALDIPTSKDVIDGSEVSDVFYKNKDWKKIISEYCEKDVDRTAQIFKKLKQI